MPGCVGGVYGHDFKQTDLSFFFLAPAELASRKNN
jgi:hypothetical protein